VELEVIPINSAPKSVSTFNWALANANYSLFDW